MSVEDFDNAFLNDLENELQPEDNASWFFYYFIFFLFLMFVIIMVTCLAF